VIEHDSVIRLAPGVRLHVENDETGFVESPDGVRRLAGTGLRLLADELLPRLAAPARSGDVANDLAALLSREQVLALLEGLHGQGIIEFPPARPPLARGGRIAVLGRAGVTCDLVALLRRTPGTEVDDLGEVTAPALERLAETDPALVAVATASIFDPDAGVVNAWSVSRGRACLPFGMTHGGSAFAGPLWAPGRAAGCYECLRTRIYANSIHGPTWRSYTRSLAEAGTSAIPQEAPPWQIAQLAGAVGRRIDAWFAETPDDSGGDLCWLDANGTESDRCLLLVPTCQVCGGLDREPGPQVALTAAVDDRVGVVHSVNLRRAESGPRIYLAGSTTADLSLIRPNLGVIRNGGAGFVKKDALNATIGESLERYAAGLWHRADLRLASWTELTAAGERAAPPDSFGLFSAEQYAEPEFGFVPFTEDTRVRWVRATRWPDGDPCWVPACQVHLYYRRVAGEAAIAPSISTGLAAGPSREEAVLGGLCEIIERDALAISWLHRLPPRPVPAEVIASSSRLAYHLSGAASWQVSFYDLSLDLTPPVIVAVMDYHGGPEPVLSFGSACRTHPSRAVEKAFLEAAQGLTYVRRLVKEYRDFEIMPGFANVDEFNKHAVLYTRHPELRARAGYLVHPEVPPSCDRPVRPAAAPSGDPVAGIVAELAGIGLSTYVVDLTTPDTRRAGVHVVRVLVPGLQHLSGTHRYRLLGNPRLREAVRALGYDSEPDNPYPHPLP
jgi:ribosomal protein S12 methylthiotransferase accessory factor